jgi:O-antigen/teichoic acid export membrane protein
MFVVTRDHGSSIGWLEVSAILLGEILFGRVAASTELVMVAHQHQVAASLVRLFTALSRLALAATFFLLLDHGDELGTWVRLVLLQSLLLSLVYLLFIVHLYGRPVWALQRREIGSGIAFALNQTARAAQSNADRVTLAYVSSDATLGAYAAGSRILQIGLVPIQTATRILYPRFFVHGASGLPAARAFALRCTPVMLATGVGSAIMVSAIGLVAPRILGQSFAATAQWAPLLSLSLPLIALQYPAADALTGGGHQRLRTLLYVASTCGFGVVLALGALLDGVRGVVFAMLLGHASFAAVLWGATYLAERRSVPADGVVLTGSDA